MLCHTGGCKPSVSRTYLSGSEGERGPTLQSPGIFGKWKYHIFLYKGD